MSFNESNTVEQMVLDAVSKIGNSGGKNLRENRPGWGGSLGDEFKPVLWDYIMAVLAHSFYNNSQAPFLTQKNLPY